MNIQGVGIDTVDVARIRTILADGRDQFFNNTFTKIEINYCNSRTDVAPHLAGTFAAKEAYRKATGDFNLAFNEIGVEHEPAGKPYVAVTGVRDVRCYLSITHTSTTATAIVIITS